MQDGSRPSVAATELDPALVSTPFAVQTSWHVITGAPCSGKSTLIDLLAGRGFETLPEIGRTYVEREMAKGRTGDEIFADGASLVRGILALQLRAEQSLPANKVAFLDRAFPDGLAYSRVHGLDPGEFLPQCFCHRYASVFVLDRLPIQHDGVRHEDDETAAFIDVWLSRDYGALGYNVVRVPVLPPAERLAFVLERLP